MQDAPERLLSTAESAGAAAPPDTARAESPPNMLHPDQVAALGGLMEAARPDVIDRRREDRSRRVIRSISTSLLCGMLAALDASAITLAGCLALLAYGDMGYVAQEGVRYLSLALAGGVGTVLLAHTARLYRMDTLSTPFLRPWQIIGCWCAALLLILGGVFFVHPMDALSRGWVGGWFGFSVAGLGLVRLCMRRAILRWRAQGRMARPVVVVGNFDAVSAMVYRLAQPELADFYCVAGVLFDGAAPPGSLPPQVSVLGSTPALLDFARQKAVETALICIGAQPSEVAREVSAALADLPIDVMLSPDNDCFPMPVVGLRRLGGVPLLEVSRPPLGDWARIAKGLEDRIVAAILLVVLAPAMIIAALWVRLDSPGPALFRQRRWGFNNKVISVLKFRTMRVDLGDVSGAQRTVRGDPRVTRAGRILRATSIDELPQLINVLRGEMSLVGPRAHPVAMRVADQLYHEAVQGYVARHRVKPGMTGLAQINGCRGEVSTMHEARERVRYDLEYASRWSLWLDFKILLLTPIRALRKTY